MKKWPLPRFSVGRFFGDQNRWRNVAWKISGISPLKKECSVWVEKPVMTRRQVMRFKVEFYQKLNCITTPGNGLVTRGEGNIFFGQFFLWSILLSPFSFFFGP